MSKEWVKVFEIDGRQVLCHKDFNNEEGDAKEMIIISMFPDGCKVDAKLTFQTEEVRDKAFEGLGIAGVVNFAKAIMDEFRL